AFGGTKNPDVAGIIALAPDLVIANKEENRREDIEALKGAGVRVMLTDPNTVDEALAMILEIGQLLGASTRAEAMVADASEALREPGLPGTRVFVPVWREPLMGLGSGTYGSDLLERCGAVNGGGRGIRRWKPGPPAHGRPMRSCSPTSRTGSG
ncbi:MAG TPA: helical backbone metal receptor, partial [Tepidiformaceae bacterium]|nr:helical backbone metal receptor [Tepidiformaceae bacterium]